MLLTQKWRFIELHVQTFDVSLGDLGASAEIAGWSPERCETRSYLLLDAPLRSLLPIIIIIIVISLYVFTHYYYYSIVTIITIIMIVLCW